MPPITDPALLEEIKRQQARQPVTLATPPPSPMEPYYASPPPPMPAGLPTGKREGDPYVGPRYELSAAANARAERISPAQISKENAEAAQANLKLKQMQEDWNLKHPKGGPITVVGPMAIADLPSGEQDIVKGITQGRVPVSSLALARNPKLFELVQRAFAYEPGTDLTTFQRRQAAFQKFTSNPNSPMVRVNQALQHLDRFYQNAHGLDNFHSGFFSSIANYPRAAYMSVKKDPRFEAFATDRDALASELAAAFQGSGQSALADREEWKKRLSSANSPESFDAAIAEAVQLLGGRVEASNAQFKQAVGANAEFYDLMSPKAREVFDKYSAPDFGLKPKEDKTLSTDTKTLKVPPGYQDDHAQFLIQHPPGSLTVADYIKFRQATDKKFGVESPGIEDEAEKFVKGYNETPNFNPQSPVPMGEEKLSDKGVLGTSFLSEKDRAEGGASGIGTALANYGNAATGGLVDLAVGQEGRDALELANEKNKGSAFAGEIAGAVTGMGSLEVGVAKLAAKLGVSEAKVAKALGSVGRAKAAHGVGMNAAYGGMRGFSGADEGEGGQGALEGVAGGALGGAGGEVITRGVTPLLSEGTQKALTQLKGVKTTTLQKLGFGRAEESLSGVPFAHGARQAAIRSMNVDNADRVLANLVDASGKKIKVPRTIFGKSVAEPGTDLNAYVNDQINQAYGKIRPKIFGAADIQFDNSLTALQAKANTPEKKAMFQEIKDAVDLFKDPITGLYNGDGYQAASMRLRSLVKDFSTQAENSGSTSARDMARMAEQARKQMQFQIQRTAPEVAAELKGIERAYAHSMRVEDATNRALTASDTGVYSPGQLLTSIKKLDTSLNKGATARGKAFDQQYAEAAARILGHGNVPKISVKETGVAATVLGLGGYASPHLAAFLGIAGTGLYGPGVKKGVQTILSGKRPDNLVMDGLRYALSDYIRNSMTGE